MEDVGDAGLMTMEMTLIGENRKTDASSQKGCYHNCWQTLAAFGPPNVMRYRLRMLLGKSFLNHVKFRFLFRNGNNYLFCDFSSVYLFDNLRAIGRSYLFATDRLSFGECMHQFSS